MIRNLIRFLVLLFVVAVVRYFIATISQMVSKAVNAGGRPAAPPSAGSHGELKRDPVCGTFVAAESSITRTVNGELLHFCSVACRDKFRAA